MPVITLDIGPQSPELKAALIRQFTQTAVDLTKIPAENFIVLINELPLDNIGVGGQPLSERFKK